MHVKIWLWNYKVHNHTSCLGVFFLVYTMLLHPRFFMHCNENWNGHNSVILCRNDLKLFGLVNEGSNAELPNCPSLRGRLLTRLAPSNQSCCHFFSSFRPLYLQYLKMDWIRTISDRIFWDVQKVTLAGMCEKLAKIKHAQKWIKIGGDVQHTQA